MNEDRIQALKKFILNDLEKEGIDISDGFSKMLFQSPSTLRLRYFGYNMLKRYYEYKDFPLDERLTGKELLTLKNKVGYPYYLPNNHTHIALFTLKQSFVLKLNGGDVKTWLKNLENKSS